MTWRPLPVTDPTSSRRTTSPASWRRIAAWYGAITAPGIPPLPVS
ncbi:MAG: hypothetical protein ACLUNZ_02305 [Evtepia sp.]